MHGHRRVTLLDPGTLTGCTLIDSSADRVDKQAVSLSAGSVRSKVTYGVSGMSKKSIETKPKDTVLEAAADWQTRARGTNSSEYDIYVACVSGSGEPVKSYEEWLNS